MPSANAAASRIHRRDTPRSPSNLRALRPCDAFALTAATARDSGGWRERQGRGDRARGVEKAGRSSIMNNSGLHVVPKEEDELTAWCFVVVKFTLSGPTHERGRLAAREGAILAEKRNLTLGTKIWGSTLLIRYLSTSPNRILPIERVHAKNGTQTGEVHQKLFFLGNLPCATNTLPTAKNGDEPKLLIAATKQKKQRQTQRISKGRKYSAITGHTQGIQEISETK